MISFELTKDKRRLKVSEYSLNSELASAHSFFQKKSKDSDFNALVDNGVWDGMDKFMSKDNSIPVGLWKELWNFSQLYNVPVEFDVKPILDKGFNKERYIKFVNALFKGVLTDKGEPLYPRDYQIEGAFRALKYKFCCEELATSSGKTAIFYILNSYLKFIGKINKENKAILIVPNVSLVGQTERAFKQYTNGLVNWDICTIGGDKNEFDKDKFDNCDILITTYQSLLNLVPKCIEKRLENLIMKPLKKDDKDKRAKEITDIKKKLQAAKLLNICSSFKVVCVDEAHKSRGDSITHILESCINWEYKFGLSGTLKLNEEYSDFFKMQTNIGPLVMMLEAKFLMDNDYSPDIKIKQVFLEYNESDPSVSEYLRIQRNKEIREKVKNQFRNPKDFGRNMLDIEKKIIFESKERLVFINKFIKKLGKNALILFTDVKNEYGKKIVEDLKSWNDNTFYIDGGVESQDRDSYKEIMEKNDDVILVASYGTFATGIDLKNVHHIIFVESIKAEITIRQAIGRGMRYLEGKNEVIIWDIIDGLSGYSLKHSEERMRIYTDQSFQILKPQRVSLIDFKL